MKRPLPLLALAALLLAGCSLNEPKVATDVTAVSATVNGSVSSNESGEVTYWFRYGTTTEYGETTPDRTVEFPPGHNSDGPRIPVSESISGLEPSTTYHYQGCSSPGIAPGSRACTPQDLTFTTDSLTVQGSGTLDWVHAPTGWSTAFTIDARSEAHGQASGTFSFTNSSPPNSNPPQSQAYSGTVTCIAVSGNEATIGGVVTDSDIGGGLSPGARVRITVRDADAGSGGDALSRWTVQRDPSDCALDPTNYHSLASGNITVDG